MARPISKTTKFILSLPKALSAKEVLAKAKARGIVTSENNVHRVRRLHIVAPAKAQANGSAAGSPKAVQSRSKPVPAKGLPVKAMAPVAVQKGAGSSVDDLLLAVAAELGLARAVDILQGERARVQALLGG
jgi:hypothetical protein